MQKYVRTSLLLGQDFAYVQVDQKILWIICSYAPDAELGQDFDVLCSVNDAKIFLPQKRSPWPSILLKVGGHDGDYGIFGCQVLKKETQTIDIFWAKKQHTLKKKYIL